MKNKNIALLVPLLVVATVLAASFTFGTPTAHGAPLSVLTVDCTPLVSPGGSSFGAQNTMGMALQSVDIGGDFIVTEDTPAAFRARPAASLAAFDLIAINNHPVRLGDGCIQGAGTGLGATWQGVIGINSGGRVLLTSHDAPRFHMNAPAGSLFFGGGSPGPGVEPFGAPDLVRQAALWAGGGSNTGLLIFNDSPGFAGGVGWDNAELNLPAAWSITDLPQIFGIGDGGYTDILPAFAGHPVYAGLSDGRFAVNTISSFSANIGDGSFDSIFGSFNAGIFTVTEAVINAGIIDVGGFGVGSGTAAPGPDGSAITLIRDELKEPTSTPTITPTPKPPVDPPFISETLAAGTGIKIEKTVHVPSFAPLVDVVFAMDLTGSMGGALTNLKAEIATIIADLEAAAGPADLEIGIVSFMDYNGSFDSNPACGYNTSYGSGLDTPFRVDKPVTDDFVAVQAEVAGWVLGFGEDGPEDYGRIVWEAAQPDSGIGYRAGAQKILVMFGDNIPHDCDLSAGGPAPDFGSVTGINPGRNNVIDFGGDDIDWQDDAIPAAQAAGVKLLVVNNGLNVAFWDFWSQETGGDAEEINPDGTVPGGLDLSDVILGLIRGVTVNSVTAEAVGCDPLVISFLPPSVGPVNPPAQVEFSETIFVPAGTPSGKIDCVVEFFADGALIAVQEINITVAILKGRMTGGGSVFTQDNVRVTHGFTLHCKFDDLPNNLEVNWEGNRFHMELLDSALCTDDPNIDPRPPTADFDTYEGEGTGRYNGVSGATAEWTFTDAGQPGRNDTAFIRIFDAGGDLVLEVQNNLRNGNHQAHRGPPKDQPTETPTPTAGCVLPGAAGAIPATATDTPRPATPTDTPTASPDVCTPTPTNTPTPTSTPTNTPTPGGKPAVSIGSLKMDVGESDTVDLRSLSIPPPGLGAWTIDIEYDSSVVSVLFCASHPTGVCNPNFGVITIRSTGASSGGLLGDTTLATIGFECDRFGSSGLLLTLQVFADATIGDPQDIRDITNVLNGKIDCNGPTPTNTDTPSVTPTPTNTDTPTNTPTPTVTPTVTNTPPTACPAGKAPFPGGCGTPTITPTNTPTPKKPEMALNIKSGDSDTGGGLAPSTICNDPVRPTKCSVPVGSQFILSVDVLNAPAEGYVGLQTFIDYGPNLFYEKAPLADDEVVWEDKQMAIRDQPAPGLVAHGALTGLIPPLPLSFLEGNVVDLLMNCTTFPSSTDVKLLPVGDPVGGTSGTAFIDEDGGTSAPNLNPLTINCVDPDIALADTDGDGCTDLQELGLDEESGGQRDPNNPWDFYDTNGDRVVDLPNDILGVITAFNAYNVIYDRGPSTGPNPWNMTAPDGVIDLPNDILGVISQFQHSCV